MSWDYVVVGAGLFGSVFAQQATEAGRTVAVIDRRNHIGGNCFTSTDEETGINVHAYGTHIFHTNSERVWWYMNRFTEFNSYHHTVLTNLGGDLYPMPINLTTLNHFFGKRLTPSDAATFLERLREPIEHPANLEEKARSLVGTALYDAFIAGYTTKHWGRHPRDLPANIITRLPVRTSHESGYFSDRYQGIPTHGYTPIFERMLRKADVFLDTDYMNDKVYWHARARRKLVYSGPIDAYFEHTYGRLSWRSVNHEVQVIDEPDYQGIAVMNFADASVPYTRIHEPRHLHPELAGTMSAEKTIIQREYSGDDASNPSYPVNAQSDKAMLRQYRTLASGEDHVIFGGRLASYAYYDMHQVVGAALTAAKGELC